MFLRAIAYSALLSLPGHWLAPAYQALLIGMTGFLLGVRLEAPPASAVDLSAANVLAVYVALCLASGFTSWRRRFAAIALGIPLLVVVECLGGIVALSLGPQLRGVGPSGTSGPGFAQQLPELARWLAVPLLWAGLLGRIALPRARNASLGSSRAPSRGRLWRTHVAR